jgi:hypothetical protein
MRHAAIPLVASLAVAACSSSGAADLATEPQASAAEAAAIAAAGADWEPLAKSTSPCERYTLRLEHAEWREEPGARPKLSLQFQLRTDEKDVLLTGGRVTDLVSSEGVEFREEGLKGNATARGGYGSLAFHGLEVYHRGDRLRRLRVEARLLRVLSWRTYDVSCSGPADRKEFTCPPYSVTLSGDQTMPWACRVGVCILADRWREYPAKQRDLVGVLGHDWVAGSATLTDSHGKGLFAQDGGGTGGFTSTTYGPEMLGGAALDSVPPTMAWPVQGAIRLPERYVVEVVPFEFIDCALERRDAAR